MKLTDILDPESILVGMKPASKKDAITALVDVLAEKKRIADRDQVLQAVLDREETRSTIVGNGLAVPHGKSVGSPELVMAIGTVAEPVDWDSPDPDADPVQLIVLVSSPPDKTGPHIQALARIARLHLIEKFRTAICSATEAKEIFDLICKYEV